MGERRILKGRYVEFRRGLDDPLVLLTATLLRLLRVYGHGDRRRPNVQRRLPIKFPLSLLRYEYP